MIFAPLLLAVVTATIKPAAPTIGDPITIDFPQPATVDASPDYEVVSQNGTRVVLRTFKPKPFKVSGRMGGGSFRDLVVPVRSVLQPKDALQPAPLVAPKPLPYPRAPFVAIGVAALCAIAAWTAVVLRARRRVVAEEPQLPPNERFRIAVANARNWAMLAEAVRDYLAATRAIGRELTTAEVLQRDRDFAEVLRNADLEKFSPWGVPLDDFGKAKADTERAA
jgi:hypothetical protein